MKYAILFGLIFLFGCMQRDSETAEPCYAEARLGFYQPDNPEFISNTWIRKPENIKVAHETLKDFGYENLYTKFELYDSPCEIFGLGKYVLKPCNVIVDSLVLSYSSHIHATKYYKEFWERRINEGNDSVVYEVLKEIKAELLDEELMEVSNLYVNDTIKTLLRIYLKEPTSDAQALNDFKFLKSIGLNLSAHNLLYEWLPYQHIKWNRELLNDELLRDTLSNCSDPVIPDNSK